MSVSLPVYLIHPSVLRRRNHESLLVSVRGVTPSHSCHKCSVLCLPSDCISVSVRSALSLCVIIALSLVP